MMLWAIVQRSANMGKEAEYSYSDLYDKVQSGQLLDAVIQGNELRGHLKVSPKDEFRTTLPPNYDDLLQAMLAAKVNVAIRAPRSHFLRPLAGQRAVQSRSWFWLSFWSCPRSGSSSKRRASSQFSLS